MLRFFQHRTLRTLFILPTMNGQWQPIPPSETQTVCSSVDMFVRQADNLGHPERECGRITVHTTIVQVYLSEISREMALYIDRDLVRHVSALLTVFQLQRALPRHTQLVLVDVGPYGDGHLFDIYRKKEIFDEDRKVDCCRRKQQHFHRLPMAYLNPVIAKILPSLFFDGSERIFVPCSAQDFHCDLLLMQALAVRVWGDCAGAAYQYELEY